MVSNSNATGISNSEAHRAGTAKARFNSHNSKCLNDAYRKQRNNVTDLMHGDCLDETALSMSKQVNIYASKVASIIGKTPSDELNMSSYIHMEMNRLFANDNRLNEMVVYNYLTRYYKSEIARAKSQNK